MDASMNEIAQEIAKIGQWLIMFALGVLVGYGLHDWIAFGRWVCRQLAAAIERAALDDDHAETGAPATPPPVQAADAANGEHRHAEQIEH